MPRPIHANLDFSALEHNLRVVRRSTAARVMAVIKAEAYGHGLLPTAEALRQADGFALLDIQDAVRLREAGFRQPILLLEGFFSTGDLPLLAEYELSSVIHSAEQLAMLGHYPRRGGLSVWLKLNTGMNRLGFAAAQFPSALEALRRHPAVRDVTLMTHFAQADEEPGVAMQLEKFQALTAGYRLPRSMANSAALLRYPQTHGDWVRPGLMLYGASPFPGVSAVELGLRPVMTLASRIISVTELNAGDRVGYGGQFRADRAMRIGTVACGYADGYPRHAATGTPLLVHGRLARTLGRVSMDMLSVDLSDHPEAGVGSPVVLWGAGMPVEDVARAAGTLSYELLCALARRVPVR
jgi:alanine racemase